MRKSLSSTINIVFVLIILSACAKPTTVPIIGTDTPFQASAVPATATLTSTPPLSLSITLGQTNISQGITLSQGGDVDSQVVSVGSPAVDARASGNGIALPAGNSTPDSYLQFNVDDQRLFAGKPTSHVRLEVDYFDQGTNSFSLQYDSLAGTFAGGGSVVKTNTGKMRTASFNVCDANFSNRDNGADFRIADDGKGAVIIRAVRLNGLPSGVAMVNVDAFGANPMDNQPDSASIQAALDSTCSGDTVVFTSGVNSPGYTGYMIDKTLFLTGMSAKQDLTFTSSNPADHALLHATADLKGFVVRLYARSRFSDAGRIDNINFGFIDVNGGRDVRKCLGSDQQINGIDDNWGSWLPECTLAGDPWCSPGNIGIEGGLDTSDATQNYQANPDKWTTGIVVHDVVDAQAECGSAFAFGSAAGTIKNVTIDTAGDHVHVAGCAYTDNDGDKTGWSDGMTIFGPAHTITDNTVIDPSDVGIVYFGGKNTIISNNTIRITPGNYGAFAGIAIHPWSLGDISGLQVIGNHVTSEGDPKCGGLHVGINLGPQMWGGACVATSTGAMDGNSTCSNNPPQPKGSPCTGGPCQLWAYVPANATVTMEDNVVTGAQINYLVDGLDLVGQLIDQNNTSNSPRQSDWEGSKGCQGISWGALDKVAHDPSLPGWTDLRIHCER
jgi:parallel beta-helix repeat protein